MCAIPGETLARLLAQLAHLLAQPVDSMALLQLGSRKALRLWVWAFDTLFRLGDDPICSPPEMWSGCHRIPRRLGRCSAGVGQSLSIR